MKPPEEIYLIAIIAEQPFSPLWFSDPPPSYCEQQEKYIRADVVDDMVRAAGVEKAERLKSFLNEIQGASPDTGFDDEFKQWIKEKHRKEL